MTFGINVQGGTGAGSKRGKRPPKDSWWTCKCGWGNKPSWTRCMARGCNKPRP